MCEYISAIYNPSTKEVKVANLRSHHITYLLTGVVGCKWHEMHYRPDGSIVCRTPEYHNNTAMEAFVKDKWPTFEAFEKWAIEKSSNYYYGGEQCTN